jgi:hypothetical protein
LEAEKAAIWVRARAMAERVIEGRTLKQIGDEWGINKDRVRQIVVGTAGRAAGWPADFDRSTKSCAKQLVEADEQARIS